jgi:glycosyltransferase involved in cell wall biosynthesis
MKVVFDARELTEDHCAAGIGHYIGSLFKAVAEQEPSVQLTAFSHRRDVPIDEDAGIESIPLKQAYFGKWSRVLWERFAWGKQIDRQGCDLFHSTAHLSPGPMKTPMVLTVHDMTNFLFPQMYKWTNQINRCRQLKRGFRQAERIIAVSKSTRDDLIRLFPETKSKVRVIYEGADPVFHPHPEVDRASIGIHFEEPFILWVGTTSPRKNLQGLLEAFREIHSRGCHPYLVFVGQRGWKDHSIFDFIHRHRLDHYIHLAGYQPHHKLPLYYSACAAFVFPSLYEGFGLPVLEAMACGAPVLASRNSSLPELVAGEESLFDPSGTIELADKLQRLLENPAMREDLSRAGIEKAREFSWEKAARQTIEVYREICPQS